MTVCEPCGSDSANYYVCFICAGHASDLISNAVNTLPMLSEARHSRDGAHRAGHPGSKPPVSLHALEVGTQLRQALAQVAAVMHVKPGELLGNLHRIKLTSGLADPLDHLGTVYGKALELINPPQERQLIGHCVECDGQLITHPGAQDARCLGCGLVLNDAPMIRAMRAAVVHREQMTIAAAVKLFDGCGIILKENTAQGWARQGRITPDTNGLIRLGDLLAVVQHPPKRGRVPRPGVPGAS